MEPLPLRDIHLPLAIGWWPPAPGWWLLMVLAAMLAGGLIWLVRRRRQPTPVKLALRELDDLRLDTNLPADEKLRRLGMLLRRINLSLYPREQVAGLAGEDWLRWLDQALGSPRFSEGVGRLLADAPYRAQPRADIEALLILCRDWVKAAEKGRRRRVRGKVPTA